MKLSPSVVIGLGSTGKNVVNSIQRFLYEVLNTDSLDIFQFLVIETDTNNMSDAGRASMLNIFESDSGFVYKTMKSVVGTDWDWCPQNLRTEAGVGAGIMRAGGRMMFVYNYAKVKEAIARAVTEVIRAASTHQTTEHLLQLKPGAVINPDLIDDPNDVTIYVIGTLTGGTCSGACVDLGYQVRRFHPTAKPIGIFVIPDHENIPAYKANAWAAMSDLEYFAHHPEDYKVSWRDAGNNRAAFSGTDVNGGPYDLVYLASRRNKKGSAQLSYEPFEPSAPLFTMLGLHVASDLLGMYRLRSAKWSNMQQHLNGGIPDPTTNLFMNVNVRAISYPKYEISEAAACQLISSRICKNWLSESEYSVRGEIVKIAEDRAKQTGRDMWNTLAPQILSGLRADVDINELATDVAKKEMSKPREYVKTQFSSDQAGTIYARVKQHEVSRVALLQDSIKALFVANLAENKNLKVAELFLAGIREEITRSLSYWNQYGVPAINDRTAWAAHVDTRISEIGSQRRSVLVFSLFLAADALEDGLSDLLLRLEMFIMSKALNEVLEYIEAQLVGLLKRIKYVLTAVQQLSEARLKILVSSLNDTRGPILKVSRLAAQEFTKEIEALADTNPELRDDDYIKLNRDGTMSGLFAVGLEAQNNEIKDILAKLKNANQPFLLRRLGPVDIVQRVSDRGMLTLAAQRASVAHDLSIATTGELVTGADIVPAFLSAKTQNDANRLKVELAAAQPNFPGFSAVELPLFDHMAIFHQEAADIIPERSLEDATDFIAAYQASMQVKPEILSPFRHLKQKTITHPRANAVQAAQAKAAGEDQ
jgi:hypothetical protein